MRLIPLVLFCIVIGAYGVVAQDDARPTATWQVQKYEIDPTLPQNASDRSLTVNAVLTLKNVSNAPASTLSLRISPSAEITRVKINGNNADFTKREEKLGSGGSLQRVSIRIPAVPNGSTLTAAVDYKLAVKENSGLAAISPVGSLFLPLSFWYPTPNSWYFARGADHAPFRIRVAAPGQTVVSSGTESSGSFEQNRSSQPFFLVGNWDVTNSNGVSVYLPKAASTDEGKRAAEAALLISEAKSFVAKLLGTIPDVPLRLVTTRRGSGFSGGGTILVDENALRRPKLDSQTVMTITEAVARLWIGTFAAVVGDGQGVIKEGLVRFIATEFLENKYGKDVADIERFRQRAAYSVVSRRDAPLTTITPMDDYYFPAVANKGAMVWRMLAKRVGNTEFYNILNANSSDRQLDLAELRAAFSSQKELLDYQLDQVTDTNLIVGLPQLAGAETKIALRNTGPIDATVSVSAATAAGEKLSAQSTIRAREFGEISFRTSQKILRVEVDTEKLYPQMEYWDDVAPREFRENDVHLAVKRSFDKQDFTGAERSARNVLRDHPRLDDVRVLLARSLLAQGRNAEAEREFKAVLDEKLPSARSIAWANVGLGQIAAKAGQNPQAIKFADDAVRADAEYGATLAARNLRNTAGGATAADDTVKAFFAQFDKAAVANRKAEIDSMVVPGEAVRFASGVAGQTEQWQTQVQRIDRIDPENVLVETALTVKLLNREPESGMAVFRLTKVGGAWKLSNVEILEVR